MTSFNFYFLKLNIEKKTYICKRPMNLVCIFFNEFIIYVIFHRLLDIFLVLFLCEKFSKPNRSITTNLNIDCEMYYNRPFNRSLIEIILKNITVLR